MIASRSPPSRPPNQVLTSFECLRLSLRQASRTAHCPARPSPATSRRTSSSSTLSPARTRCPHALERTTAPTAIERSDGCPQLHCPPCERLHAGAPTSPLTSPLTSPCALHARLHAGTRSRSPSCLHRTPRARASSQRSCAVRSPPELEPYTAFHGLPRPSTRPSARPCMAIPPDLPRPSQACSTSSSCMRAMRPSGAST